jgi:hypothetical protein
MRPPPKVQWMVSIHNEAHRAEQPTSIFEMRAIIQFLCGVCARRCRLCRCGSWGCLEERWLPCERLNFSHLPLHETDICYPIDSQWSFSVSALPISFPAQTQPLSKTPRVMWKTIQKWTRTMKLLRQIKRRKGCVLAFHLPLPLSTRA